MLKFDVDGVKPREELCYLQWDGSEREDGMELVRDAGAGAGARER